MKMYKRDRRYYGRNTHSFKRHFSTNRFKGLFNKGFYRSRKGIILGVCGGIAEYFNFSVFWVRVIALALLLFTGLWPTGVIYIIAGFIMKLRPAATFNSEDRQGFYDSHRRSKSVATDPIKRRYNDLQRRIQRLENDVTRP